MSRELYLSQPQKRNFLSKCLAKEPAYLTELKIADLQSKILHQLIILTLIFIFDIIQQATQDNQNWSNDLAKIIGSGVFILLFCLGRLLLLKILGFPNKKIMLGITDIIIILLFLIYAYSELESIFKYGISIQMSSLMMMRFYTVAYVIRIGLYYQQFHVVNIILITTIAIIIITTEFSMKTSQWVMPLASFLLGNAYIFLLENKRTVEVQKTKLHELDKEKPFKDMLDMVQEGFIGFNQLGNIKIITPSFSKILSITGFGDGNDPLQSSVQEIQSSKQFTIKEFPKSVKSQTQSIGYKINDIFSMIQKKWDTFLLRTQEGRGKPIDLLIKTNDEEVIQKMIEVKANFTTFQEEQICIITFIDVTEKLIANTLKETIDFKDHLLTSFSHELKIPLDSNINLIQAAKDDQTISGFCKDKFLSPALQSARYIMTIINDLIDLSLVNNRTIKLVPYKKSFVATIKEAISFVSSQANSKGIEIDLKLPSDQWDYQLNTDHERLLQIMNNLISNALKFTSEGEISVTIGIEKKSNNNRNGINVRNSENDERNNDENNRNENNEVINDHNNEENNRNENIEENKQANDYNDTNNIPNQQQNQLQDNLIFKIEVEDTGVGIQSERKRALSQRFENPEVNLGPGIGLGLIVSNALSKLLGPGKDDQSKYGIKFDSKEGEGSKFYFYIINQVNDFINLGDLAFSDEDGRDADIAETLSSVATFRFQQTENDDDFSSAIRSENRPIRQQPQLKKGHKISKIMKDWHDNDHKFLSLEQSNTHYAGAAETTNITMNTQASFLGGQQQQQHQQNKPHQISFTSAIKENPEDSGILQQEDDGMNQSTHQMSNIMKRRQQQNAASNKPHLLTVTTTKSDQQKHLHEQQKNNGEEKKEQATYINLPESNQELMSDTPIDSALMKKKRKISSQIDTPMFGQKIGTFNQAIALPPSQQEYREQEECNCSKVLIADDDPFNLLGAENIFGQLKISIETAYNGKEALKFLRQRNQNPCCDDCESYKLIILDCNMPILDGYETCNKIREMFKEDSTIQCPIIGCATNEKEKKAALNANMDECLMKPMSKEEIKNLLKTHNILDI